MEKSRRWQKVDFGKHSPKSYTEDTLEFLDAIDPLSSIKHIQSNPFDHYGDKKWKVKVSPNKTIRGMVYVDFQDWRGTSRWQITLNNGYMLRDCYREIHASVKRWREEVDVVPFGFKIQGDDQPDAHESEECTGSSASSAERDDLKCIPDDTSNGDKPVRVLRYENTLEIWKNKKRVRVYRDLHEAAERDGEKQEDGTILFLDPVNIIVRALCIAPKSAYEHMNWLVGGGILEKEEKGFWRLILVAGMPTVEEFVANRPKRRRKQTDDERIREGMHREMALFHKKLDAAECRNKILEETITVLRDKVSALEGQRQDARSVEDVVSVEDTDVEIFANRINGLIDQFFDCAQIVRGYEFLAEMIESSHKMEEEKSSDAFYEHQGWCESKLEEIKNQYLFLAKEWGHIEFLYSCLQRMCRGGMDKERVLGETRRLMASFEVENFLQRMRELTGIHYKDEYVAFV